MGNAIYSQSSLENLNFQKYMRPGITKNDVIDIHGYFQELEPTEGRVKVEKIRRLYETSPDAQQIDRRVGNKQFLTFDEFFEVMSDNILEKKQKYQGIEFEAVSPQPTMCFFCSPQSLDGNPYNNSQVGSGTASSGIGLAQQSQSVPYSFVPANKYAIQQSQQQVIKENFYDYPDNSRMIQQQQGTLAYNRFQVGGGPGQVVHY